MDDRMTESLKAVLEQARSRTKLDGWLRANWNRIPVPDRRRCVDHLRARLPAEVVELMRAQHERGLTIGSHDPRFHFSYGMHVRNELRAVLDDKDLPAIVGPDGGYPQGEEARNWDDFYMGALEQLCEEAGRVKE